MTDSTDLQTAYDEFLESSRLYKSALKDLGNKKFTLAQKEGEVHEKHWRATQTGDMTMASFNQLLKHEVWKEKMNVDVSRTALNIAKQNLEDATERMNYLKKLISIR